MKIAIKILVFLLAAPLLAGHSAAEARWSFDIGTGAVFSEQNDVRAPNNSGTDISLSDELETDSRYFLRVKLAYSKRKHNIAVIAAPLRLTAGGKVEKSVNFEGEEFSANIPLTAVYRFDSYRLSYRYDLFHTRRFQAGFGATAKVRSTTITVEGDGKESRRKNTALVPLVNFRAQLVLTERLSLLLDGDALAVAQGRTEDVLFAVRYKLNKYAALKFGYRILEGRTDVDEVYNFTQLNYLTVGSVIAF